MITDIFLCENKVITKSISKGCKTNENNSNVLKIHIDNGITDKSLYLDIKTPDGTKYRTTELAVTNNVAEYKLSNVLLENTGTLEIEAIMQDNNGYVLKYPTIEIPIDDSINAIESIPEDNPTLAVQMQEVIDCFCDTGTGVNFLSDDGTYKEVSSGTSDYNELLNKPITQITNLDETTPIILKDLQTGVYILTGWCTPYAGSDVYMSAGNAVTFVNNFTTVTAIQIFYPPYNQVQYFEIYEDSYIENMVQMNKAENTDNKVTTIDENSTDTQYPTAKAVKDYIDSLLN